MAKLLRWTGYGLGVLLLVLLVAAAVLWIWSDRVMAQRSNPAPLTLAAATPAQVADAPRMLRVHGCVSCHGEGLRGRLFLDEPAVGQVYAPNIPLLARTASDAQLDRAIRQGIGHDGRSLWIMPSAGYQFMTDQEAAALIAAIRALPVGGEQTPPISFGPLARVGIVNGSFKAQPAMVSDYRRAPLPALGIGLEKGRHLTQVNCADCHGPQLTGKEIEPGVVSADLSIVGAYDQAQFRKLLRQGQAPSGKDLGLMREVAVDDFNYLRDDEIDAIHAYLVERAQRAN